jgi:hypothetical protein
MTLIHYWLAIIIFSSLASHIDTSFISFFAWLAINIIDITIDRHISWLIIDITIDISSKIIE